MKQPRWFEQKIRRFRGIAILLVLVLLVSGWYIAKQQAPSSETYVPATRILSGSTPHSAPSTHPATNATAASGITTLPPILFATTARPVDTVTKPTTAAPTMSPTAKPEAITQPSQGLTIATPLPGERIPTIKLDQLPPQAHDVIRLIARGGPFPYRQDGVVFQNRENRLPRKPQGYYQEYTVETPGSPDRGPRRIVVGAQGELYYTEDHYASFKRIVP